MTAARPRKAPARRAAPPSVAAREAEAEDGFVVFEQRGVEVRLPLKGNITLAVIDMYRAGDTYGGTKLMIGEDQWKRLVAAGATDGDLDELTEKLNKLSGN